MSHAAFPIVLAFVGALLVAVYLMRHRRHLHASYPARTLLPSAKKIGRQRSTRRWGNDHPAQGHCSEAIAA
jgi:hypothetical protein